VKAYVVVSAPFFSERSYPLVASTSKSKLETWLKENGWEKSKEPQNKGLWKKKGICGVDYDWARIDNSYGEFEIV
jgi:hypothetical protein